MTAKKDPASEPGKDGRVMRSERSRLALIDAAYQIMEASAVVPTAQTIADAAGVTIRTLFRHFPEMDLLYRELHLRVQQNYAKEYDKGDRTGSLEARVESAVETFTNAYSKQRNVFLVTKSMLPTSVFLQKNYSLVQKRFSDRLLEWIPELAKLPTERHEGVDALLSFEFWHRLNVIQGVSKKRTVALTKRLILDLLAE